MGFWDYFYISLFVVLILIVVYGFVILVINTQRIKKIYNKVAVKKSIKLNIIWVVLSVFNSFVNLDQYITALERNNTEDTKLYLLAFFSWTLCGICHIVTIFLDKYDYITPDGLFNKNMIKIQPKEKYRYRIDSDTLELYYKENTTPVKYKITGEKEELLKILNDNYKLYIEI